MLTLNIVLFVAGLILLVKGASWLVEGASSLARRVGMSELAIGLTIVAFGTSMPEMVVNVTSAINGVTDIAIGNIIGSNMANILLILGISAIITPIAIQSSTAWKEIPFAILAAFTLFIMASDSTFDPSSPSVLGLGDGLILISFFLIFLWYTFGMQPIEGKGDSSEKPMSIFLSVGILLLGMLALVGGGKLTIDSAVLLARSFGMSEALIGLTLIAVGTSLPELVTSVVAGLKKKSAIAVGNIVGSNIFNIFLVLGVTSTIRPLPFSDAIRVDLLLTIAATLLLFFVIHNGNIVRRISLFWKQKVGHSISRFEGSLMLAAYIGYIVFISIRG